MPELLLLASTRHSLTKTVLTTDPNNPTGPKLANSFECKLDGSPLNGEAPVYVYRDQYSGKSYARVCEVIPSGTASSDVAARAAINALKPIHYSHEDSQVRGFYVEAPDFNSREGVATAPAPAALTPSNAFAASL